MIFNRADHSIKSTSHRKSGSQGKALEKNLGHVSGNPEREQKNKHRFKRNTVAQSTVEPEPDRKKQNDFHRQHKSICLRQKPA